jgi:hypothetical protein
MAQTLQAVEMVAQEFAQPFLVLEFSMLEAEVALLTQFVLELAVLVVVAQGV